MSKAALEAEASVPLTGRDYVDPATFRNAMAHVCSPVSVVTAFDGGRPHGTTVSALTSLSAEPPMILVCLRNDSDLLALLKRGGVFGVNLLGIGQTDLALKFAGKGADKFDGVAWRLDHGIPRIDGAGVWLGCQVADFLPGGDHAIVVGWVTTAIAVGGALPLTYHGRAFGTHVPVPIESA